MRIELSNEEVQVIVNALGLARQLIEAQIEKKFVRPNEEDPWEVRDLLLNTENDLRHRWNTEIEIRKALSE